MQKRWQRENGWPSTHNTDVLPPPLETQQWGQVKSSFTVPHNRKVVNKYSCLYIWCTLCESMSLSVKLDMQKEKTHFISSLEKKSQVCDNFCRLVGFYIYYACRSSEYVYWFLLRPVIGINEWQNHWWESPHFSIIWNL